VAETRFCFTEYKTSKNNKNHQGQPFLKNYVRKLHEQEIKLLSYSFSLKENFLNYEKITILYKKE